MVNGVLFSMGFFEILQYTSTSISQTTNNKRVQNPKIGGKEIGGGTWFGL